MDLEFGINSYRTDSNTYRIDMQHVFSSITTNFLDRWVVERSKSSTR